MKKIISILLTGIMVLSLVPINAMALDNTTVDNEEVFEAQFPTALDYSAFDSVVELVNAIDENEYTQQSIENVKAKLVDRDTLTTQEQINAAVAEIATEYAMLEKKSITIDFVIIDSNENEQVQSFTYKYGETASFNVNNGETPYKWIISTTEGDQKLSGSESDVSLIVDKPSTIVAYTDVKPENAKQLTAVKFLSFSGKPLKYVYTENIYDVEMPQAPELPFYYFSEWVKLNDTTYQAKYLSDSICDGTHHRFTVMVSKASCEAYGYLIFQCSCGEQYSTDYTKPVGHNFEDDNRYCVNGCGTSNPRFDDFETNDENDSSTDVEQPTSPSNPQTDQHYGFDEGGYSNMVIAP